MIGRLVPVILFVALGILLAVGLKIADHKTEIPSPLIGKPLPPFELPVLGQPERVLTNEDLVGEPFLLNVWASWCPTCRVEHPFIEELARSGAVRVVGFNYKDELDDAQAWLARFGDPYEITLQDYSGRYAYGNQPRIAQWNLMCLARALIPLMLKVAIFMAALLV